MIQTRKIADDIWIVEDQGPKKAAYLGMIRLQNDHYTAWTAGKFIGTAENLERAVELFEK